MKQAERRVWLIRALLAEYPQRGDSKIPADEAGQ